MNIKYPSYKSQDFLFMSIVVFGVVTLSSTGVKFHSSLASALQSGVCPIILPYNGPTSVVS